MPPLPLPVGLDRLERELRNLADDVRNAAIKGENTKEYQNAVDKYNAKLAKFNQERAKAGLTAITSVEQLDKEASSGTVTSDLDRLRQQLKAEQALGNTDKAKDLEQAIAEANAAKTASMAPTTGARGISQQGFGGKVPDLETSTPIINEDYTITVKGPDNKPVAIGNRNLDNVYIVFEEKNFYERGVKSTINNVQYRNQEELIQQAYSLSKDARKKLQEEFKRIKLLPSNYNANGELDRDAAFETAFLQAHRYANQVNYNRLVNNQPLIGILDAIKEFKMEDGEGGPSVSKSISEFSISDGQAEALLEEFYTQALGVRPGKNDIEQFKEIVRKRAAKKPRVTQTTTAADGSLTTSTTKVIEEGFGAAEAQLLARRQAEARPEFAPYQMATTFYDSLLRAAQSPGGIQGPPA